MHRYLLTYLLSRDPSSWNAFAVLGKVWMHNCNNSVIYRWALCRSGFSYLNWNHCSFKATGCEICCRPTLYKQQQISDCVRDVINTVWTAEPSLPLGRRACYVGGGGNDEPGAPAIAKRSALSRVPDRWPSTNKAVPGHGLLNNSAIYS